MDLQYKSWNHSVEQRNGDLGFWWQLTIANYTQLNLTYENNRLPAITGVTKLLHEHTSWNYFAGIWLSHPASLPEMKRCQPIAQLLWMRRERPLTGRANRSTLVLKFTERLPGPGRRSTAQSRSGWILYLV